MPPARTSSTLPEISASRLKSRVKPFGRSRTKSRGQPAQDATPEPDKESNKKNAFLQLPLELKLLVVECLPTRDIPNIRLISEQWAAAGAPSMFRDGFTVRPYLDDMDRLIQVCEKPEIAKGVKYIEFFAGDMMQEQLTNAVVRMKQRLEYATGGQIKKVWNQVDAIFEPNRFSKHCSARILNDCLPALPNLEALKVTSRQCPFRGMDMPFCIVWASMEDDFDNEDEELSHFLDVDMSIDRYASILSFAINCKSIRKLDLDSFPIDFFRDRQTMTPNEPWLIDLFKSRPKPKVDLSHITDLTITIVGPGFERAYPADIGRAMALLLKWFKNLHTLDLSYEEDDDPTDECLLGFEDVFYRIKYPHLHSLRISGCDSTETALGKFLFAHKNTLRNLHIGEAGCSPEERSWKDMLTDLRDHMKLERFELYVPEAEGRIYDVNWRSVVSEGRGMIKDAKLLELYVLGKCPWPMAEVNPREEGWKRKFKAEDMRLLDLGEAELRDLLGEEWETDGESEDEDEDMDGDEEDEEESEGEYFSMDEEHGFIDDAAPNPDAEAGEWEDMDVDED